MTEVTAQPPVTPRLRNADGSANIYVTADPSLNQLTLTLTAAANADVGLPAGSPAAYGDLPAGQSAIYLYFDGLLTNEEIQDIHFTAPGWTSATYLGEDSLQYLVIAPNADVTLASGRSLDLSLTNVLVAEQPTSGTATILLAGATGISPLDATLSLFVNLANPPQPDDQPLETAVDIGFDVGDVYTGQAQTLVLHLVNKGDEPLVPGGSSAWGSSPPTFQLTLLYGDSVGDLTTVGEAGNIHGANADLYGNVWNQVDNQEQGSKPYWTMQPDQDGGGTVLGTDEQAAVEFSFTGIDATLPAGLDSAISVAYVSWSGVPGYMDGAVGVPVTKCAGPSIASFTADPPVVPYGAADVQTTLSWTTANALNVTFQVPGVSPSAVFNTPGTGPIEGGITAPPGATLGITAWQPVESGQIFASGSFVLPQVRQVDVPVAVDGTPILVLPPPGDTAYVMEGGGTRCNVVDLERLEVTRVLDLANLVESPLTIDQAMGATASSDGKLLYVAAQAEPQPPDLTITPWLLAVDPVAGAVVAQGSLGTPPAGQGVLYLTLVPSPDGRTLYASSFGIAQHGHTAEAVAYQLQVIDTSDLSVTTAYPWDGIKAAGPVVAGGLGGRAFVETGGGPATIETAGSLRVTSFANISDDNKLIPMPSATFAAGHQTVYEVAMDETTYDQATDLIDLALAVIAVDPATGALSLTDKVPLGLQVDFGLIFGLDVLLLWLGGLTALSVAGDELYFPVPPTSVGVVSTQTMDVQVWPGNPASTAPFAFATGAQAGTVYVAQSNMLSAISLAT